MQKIKIGHQAKFRDKDKMFPAAFICGLRDFALHFNFWCSACTTFDRDFDYFADAYILVMSWMVYACAHN